MIGKYRKVYGNVNLIDFNWSTRPIVEIAYKTEIRSFRSGREERDCLRLNPRVTLTYTGMVIRDLARFVKKQMLDNKNETMITKFPSGKLEVIGSYATGSTDITLGSIPFWLQVGSRLIFESSEVVFGAVVASISGTVVTLVSAIPDNLAGYCYAYRAYSGNIISDINFSNRTDSVSETEVVFEFAPDEFAVSDIPINLPQYAGSDVFLKTPNWGDTVERVYDKTNVVIDYDIGLREVFDLYPFGNDTLSATFYSLAEGEMDQLIEFVKRRLGRRNSFWMQSHESDFTVISDSAIGSSYVEIDSEFVVEYADSLTHSKVIFRFQDGTHEIRDVVSVVSGRLNLNSAVGAKFDMNTTYVNWLTRRRLASDAVTFEYLSSDIGSLKLGLTLLPVVE